MLDVYKRQALTGWERGHAGARILKQERVADEERPPLMLGGEADVYKRQLFLLTCGTGRVEDGEEGDADVGENGFPEAGEPDHAEDHEQPLDAERHDDVLPDDHAGLGGDGEHFRQARGRVVQNDRVRHFNGRFRTEACLLYTSSRELPFRGKAQRRARLQRFDGRIPQRGGNIKRPLAASGPDGRRIEAHAQALQHGRLHAQMRAGKRQFAAGRKQRPGSAELELKRAGQGGSYPLQGRQREGQGHIKFLAVGGGIPLAAELTGFERQIADGSGAGFRLREMCIRDRYSCE